MPRSVQGGRDGLTPEPTGGPQAEYHLRAAMRPDADGTPGL